MALMPSELVESYAQSGPLTVDREKGIIFGVRILGSRSRNTHGVSGVDGTEYARTALNDAARMYEGTKCFVGHARDPKVERTAGEAFGVFRNTTVKESDGSASVVGDLHFFKSHNQSGAVTEDVERGLGVFGVSHHATPGKNRIDRNRKLIVIESLASVKSIDLVTSPATNRNLWESQEQPTMKTLKTLLESLTELPPGKAKWVKSVTESADLRHAIESEGETVGDAFDAAVNTVLSDPALTAAVKSARITKLLESRERIEATADSEPVIPAVVESKPDTDELAKVAKENAALKAELAVRTLCESEGFVPKPHQLKTLQLIESEVERKALIADLKSAKATETPRSGFRRATEPQTALKDAKTFAASIRA